MRRFVEYYNDHIEMIALDEFENQEENENRSLEEITNGLFDCGDLYGEMWLETCVDMVNMLLEENGLKTDGEFIFVNKENGSSYTKIEEMLREECLSYYCDKIEFDLDDWKIYTWNTLENELKLIALNEYRNSGWNIEDYKHYGQSAGWTQDFFWLTLEKFFKEYATSMSEDDWNSATNEEKKIAMFFTNYALER